MYNNDVIWRACEYGKVYSKLQVTYGRTGSTISVDKGTRRFIMHIIDYEIATDSAVNADTLIMWFYNDMVK